jgi:hypothetical protein
VARKPTAEQARAVNNLRLGRVPATARADSAWAGDFGVIHFEHSPEPRGTWSVALTHAGSATTQLWRIEKDGRTYQV